jgi:excisionase family DNA binding protein
MRTLTAIPARSSRRLLVPLGRHRGAHRGLGANVPLSGGHQPAADALLTAGEVAALLRVTKAWVYAQTRAQQIPHISLGRYVRYRRSAVIEWITELERQSDGGARHTRMGGRTGR